VFDYFIFDIVFVLKYKSENVLSRPIPFVQQTWPRGKAGGTWSSSQGACGDASEAAQHQVEQPARHSSPRSLRAPRAQDEHAVLFVFVLFFSRALNSCLNLLAFVVADIC